MTQKIESTKQTSNEIYELLSTAIMFRAWNTIIKRFQYFSLQDIEKQKGNIRWDLIKITRRTDLKDKKGNYMYEGDIIYMPNDDVKIYVIKYHSYTFGFYKTLNTNEYISPIYWENCEIIGNIYENKELLNRS